MKSVDSFSDSVAKYVAHTRQVLGLTLDQVAQAARLYGASWSSSSVRNIEQGQASLPLPTLILLTLALGRLQGRPISIATLFSQSEELKLTEGETGITVSQEWLKEVIGTSEVVIDLNLASDFELAPSVEGSAWDKAAKLEDLKNKYLINGRPVPEELREELFRALDDARKVPQSPVTLAERRAAQKLSVDPQVLQQHAARLWGRTLEEEAFSRAGSGSTPQARGRVTRTLVEEIRQALK